MPRNGSGQYNPLTNTWNPPVTGVLATGADFQAQLNDISAAITQSVSKDGQTPMTASLPMGNNSIVGISSGTETSPSISANGDTNTGLYFPAADTVGVAVGGVNVGNFTSAGFSGNAATSTNATNATNATNLVNGNATLAAGTAAAPSLTTTGDTNTGLYFPVADTVAIATGGTERARITSDGNLLVGTTSFSYQPNNGVTLAGGSLGSVGIGHATGTGSGNGYANFTYGGTNIGSISQNGTTAVSYNSSSDYRLKENIAPMTGALAKVAALKPVTYTWKADGSDGEGFIAHELAEVCPSAVTGEKDAVDADGNPQYQGIDTSFLVATLTAAIKEQQALIEAQKTAIESLTARISALEAK